jgi:hypothetical protein
LFQGYIASLLDDIANSTCLLRGIWVPFFVAARADEVIE